MQVFVENVPGPLPTLKKIKKGTAKTLSICIIIQSLMYKLMYTLEFNILSTHF